MDDKDILAPVQSEVDVLVGNHARLLEIRLPMAALILADRGVWSSSTIATAELRTCRPVPFEGTMTMTVKQ